MIKKLKKKKFQGPKITLDRLGQIFFTLREVIRLAYQVRPGLIVVVIVLNALWGFLAVPGFYLEKLIIDKLVLATGNINWEPIFYQLILLVGLALFLSVIRIFLGNLNGFLRRTLSRYFNSGLEVMMGKKISTLGLAVLENPEFRDRFNKVERESGQRAWGLMMTLSDIPNYFVGFISAVGILILLHPLVSLGVILVSIPRFLINSRYIKKEYQLDSELSEKYRIWGWLSYFLIRSHNFMEMKILNLSDYLSQKMYKISTDVIGRRVELNKKREISSFISFLPLSLYELLVSVYLVLSVIMRKITIGSFQLFLRSLRSAEENLGGLVNSLLDIYENYIYVSDLVWFLNLDSETKKNDLKSLSVNKFGIRFKNVWFKYPRSKKWILENIDFVIKPGEKIALVGENGAGKSTLIKLLAKFYTVPRGDIFINSFNLKEIDVNEWRSKLAVLFQQFETYPFSSRETIGYGDIERIDDMDSITDSAKRTGIHEFIEELPLKYENPLSPEFEKGVYPSIGQWQRFGIARVLFRKDAELLILDEPTSNVDPEAEEKIFQELINLAIDKVLIFVTQRFSTVRIADRIIVMHEGRVVEMGTHGELMRLKGKYERLFNLQAKAYLVNRDK